VARIISVLARMMALPTGVRVWLATGHTDMRKAGLAMLVQEKLRTDLHGAICSSFAGAAVGSSR
jgi:transposase